MTEREAPKEEKEENGTAAPAGGEVRIPVPQLFWQFFRFGCFTFGGGWSIVAQMQQVYAREKKLMGEDEILDLAAVGKSVPGTMIGNVAMLFGYRMGGYWGGLACVLGMIIPPFLVLAVVTVFYGAIRGNPWVAAAMTGIRAAVAPIIFSAVVGMFQGAFAYPPCFVIAAAALVLYLGLGVSGVWLMLLGAVCGLILCEYYERRGKGKR